MPSPFLTLAMIEMLAVSARAAEKAAEDGPETPIDPDMLQHDRPLWSGLDLDERWYPDEHHTGCTSAGDEEREAKAEEKRKRRAEKRLKRAT
jgi:hypothetical protein